MSKWNQVIPVSFHWQEAQPFIVYLPIFITAMSAAGKESEEGENVPKLPLPDSEEITVRFIIFI